MLPEGVSQADTGPTYVYVLHTCPNAVGMRISLPTKEGGHGYEIPQDLRHRINVHLADPTLFDLAPTMPKPDVYEPSGSRILACVLVRSRSR
ncbi:Ribosomal RNA large subunit methyltransferase J [Ceratobasidium theobromae]|uniref:Ribosomal RNA large subunit methyltransferase J n=1 Tax=Ceratobasidium theobromae TaxID=1582974 RepID=A0A5N5QA83_9AGAM|nr:Ribosomal RNA large subunit methyltransferase J [Ceratobasidium theobromae]